MASTVLRPSGEASSSSRMFSANTRIASASASSRAYGTASKRLLPLRYEKVVRPDLIGLAMDESSCPDYNNLMFPYIVESDGTPTLSSSQGAIMRENLSALPR